MSKVSRGSIPALCCHIAIFHFKRPLVGKWILCTLQHLLPYKVRNSHFFHNYSYFIRSFFKNLSVISVLRLSALLAALVYTVDDRSWYRKRIINHARRICTRRNIARLQRCGLGGAAMKMPLYERTIRTAIPALCSRFAIFHFKRSLVLKWIWAHFQHFLHYGVPNTRLLVRYSTF